MLEQLNTWVWGSGLLVLLLGTGLFLSIRTHFFQIFGIRTIFRQTFGRLFRRDCPQRPRHRRKNASPRLRLPCVPA